MRGTRSGILGMTGEDEEIDKKLLTTKGLWWHVRHWVRFVSVETGIDVLDGLRGQSLALPPSGRNVVPGESSA